MALLANLANMNSDNRDLPEYPAYHDDQDSIERLLWLELIQLQKFESFSIHSSAYEITKTGMDFHREHREELKNDAYILAAGPLECKKDYSHCKYPRDYGNETCNKCVKAAMEAVKHVIKGDIDE